MHLRIGVLAICRCTIEPYFPPCMSYPEPVCQRFFHNVVMLQVSMMLTIGCTRSGLNSLFLFAPFLYIFTGASAYKNAIGCGALFYSRRFYCWLVQWNAYWESASCAAYVWQSTQVWCMPHKLGGREVCEPGMLQLHPVMWLVLGGGPVVPPWLAPEKIFEV